MSQHISHDLMDIALDKAEGFPFEAFAQDFFSSVDGRNFVPFGGVHDGGADGLLATEKANAFYQITVQSNHRDKIRKTVKRLRDFGRTVTRLVYVTSQTVPHIDKEEDDLSDELDINLRIRDRKYIMSHMNDSIGTINAFKNHLKRYTDFLLDIKTSHDDGYITSRHVKDPSAFVFLQHEINNQSGNKKLIHSLADTLILWSLSDTDPDQGILMSESEIRAKIFEHFSWAENVLKSHIKPRLDFLKGDTKDNRQIRWYKKGKMYCLPHETREVIALESASDESLKIKVKDELQLSASELFDADGEEYALLANCALEVINKIFENQGLLFSHFINSSNSQSSAPLVVSDCIDKVLATHTKKTGGELENYREYLESLMRGVFYHSTPNQRTFLTNLSRTYVLLFSLQAEPKIVEYFNNMSSEFKLFLGGDILVKAISERYLEPENQAARNLLKIASQSGVQLCLSECVLQEVYTHLGATYWEFHNHFRRLEQYIKPELYRNSDKILIRSYFYAKNEGKVRSWRSYIEQFVTFDKLEKDTGREEIRRYLVSEFNLKFIPNKELESVTNTDNVRLLADKLLEAGSKDNQHLAYNTSLQVHGVYGMRAKNKEVSTVSELGYKTWWMTNQTRVLKATTDIVESEHSEYIMRPEFLLNFIALAPDCNKVRDGFKNIFPTSFGVQLGHRLETKVFHDVLAQVNQWHDFEDGRITALMSDMCDTLKTNRLKRYEHQLDSRLF
ncbi:hypothetical protein PUN50_08890 [Vibrio campbellii]|uniref:Uncharacterized protein n=1 Tax=Vibrio campbellii TaxID=680 RepID=A0AAQ2XUG3_9VIBR|nr:hypothetical protein [Vibrio campbellii]WDG06867.1 hypothetical protein PUN50_08890 [Vibrio campbellii]